jgi:hypothetical protein
VSLERGLLSLVRITEELLTPWGSVALTPRHPLSALNSPTCGGRSVGIVRLRTKATEFNLVFFLPVRAFLHVKISGDVAPNPGYWNGLDVKFV